jgi:CDP-6-deoxy-D-xylo-4-hexulose-3-dehydrase
MRVNYGQNVYGREEIKAVNKALSQTTQMSTNVRIFENKISKIIGKKFCLMVNSGSSALLLALKSLNLPKNSEIITPCLNFGTAISSIVLLGFKPKLIDVEIDTLQISEDEIEKNITSKTSALLIPNLIGNVPDWEKIYKIAKKYKLKIIEDSADTLGAKINNKHTSKFSDRSITSFYGSHLISCAGNGGLVSTNDKDIYLKLKRLRSWGRESSVLKKSEDIKKRVNCKIYGKRFDKKFIFSELGFNFEPNELCAAFGVQQLNKFKKFSKTRIRNFNYHFDFFEKKKLFIVPRTLKNVWTNFLAYPIIIKKNKFFAREKLQLWLEKNNIQSRPIFSGNLLRHPAFKELRKYHKVNNFPKADYIMDQGILVGCHQGLEIKHLNYIHNKINLFLKKFR